MKKFRFCSVCCNIIAATAALALASCEKPIFDDTPATGGETNANVTQRFSAYEQQAFTRAATPIAQQFQRLNVVVFNTDGTKAKTVSQRQTDAGFGTISITLPTGTYQLVAIAHNGEGTATITSEEKATFASNKVTDTFCYYGQLVVGDSQQTQELQMTRCVAMMRLTLADGDLPDGTSRLKFYYTGGSSTLSPMTGYGCVNSKQTEYRATTADDGSPVVTYDIYTIPHEENDVLKLTVTALAADGTTLAEKTLEGIPVTRNMITTYSGSLFGASGGTTTQSGITLTADGEWGGTISYAF